MIAVNNDFYTLEELAERLKVTTQWIGEKVQEGKLIKCKVGRASYFLHSDVLNFIESGRVENIEDAKPKRTSTYVPKPSGRKSKLTEG